MLTRLGLLLLFWGLSVSHAQDFSNKGREFWIAYPAHIDGTGSVMGIYITSDVSASGTIVYGSTTINFTVAANQVTRKFLGSSGTVDGPNATAYLNNIDGVKPGAGIRIVSDQPVVVYAHIIRSARSGASLVLPVSVLGTDYIVPSYQSVAAANNNAFGEVAVIATQPNTVIEVTPAIAGVGGRMAGTTFQVNLPNAGDAYQFQGIRQGDISGTVIKSIGCKPIAVFSATTWSAFDCGSANSGDNLYQQLFPTRSWGKQFVTAPFIDRPYDIYRIYLQDPSTTVTITENGATRTLSDYNANGRFYEVKTSNPIFISANNPISVAQFMVAQGCKSGCQASTNNSNQACMTDPEMILLNPVEQTLKEVTFFSAHQNYVPPLQTNVVLHYVNIIVNKRFKSSVRIDNQAPAGTFIDIPGTDYTYLQENISASSAVNPVHRVNADTTFSAIVYGYGNVESYGYNGGTNVRDLYQFVTVKNELGTVDFPATCKNSPFRFSMTFPYEPSQIRWVFGTALNNLGVRDTALLNPTFDSTFFISNKQVYRYSLPSVYNISSVGTYPVKVLVQNPTSEGCPGEQEISYDLQVFEKPAADFSFTTDGCVSNPVQFNDRSAISGRTPIQWAWDFGNGQLSNSQNTSHTYSSPGSYNVRFAVVIDIGCVSDTATKTVVLTAPPVAKFGISSPVCVSRSIRFTDSSTSASASIAKWTWDFGDNTPKVVATTGTLQEHTFSNTGTYTVTLQVENAGGCKSQVFSRQITVSALPVPAFTIGNACLPNGNMEFTNQSSIADGSQAQFSYDWSFGDGGKASVKDPSHRYSTVGPFTASLTVVSAAGCRDSLSKTVNTIYAEPVSVFTAPAEICLGTAISFTDQSTAANSTVNKWEWDFGDGSGASAEQNPSYTYQKAGTYTAKLKVTSAIGCPSSVFTKTVVVNPLPTADFTVSAITCEKGSINFTNASAANAGTITKWAWNFGDGTGTSAQVSPSYIYASAGQYPVSLRVETNKGCISMQTTKQVKVNPLPNVGFVVPGNCINDPMTTFTDTSSIADGSQAQFTWNWNFGDGNATPASNTSTAQNGQHKYTATGSYNVSLTVTSKDGCTSSLTQVFTVNGAVPVPQFTFRNGMQHCSNDTIFVTDNSTVSPGTPVKLEIYWDYNGDPSNKLVIDKPQNGVTYKHLYPEFFAPATKAYRVKMVVYSGINCLTEKDTTITILATPDVQLETVTPVCASVPGFQLKVSPPNLPGRGIFSGRGVTEAGFFTPSAAGQGVHLIRYTFTADNGCVNSREQIITVLPVPTVSAGPDKFVLEGGTAVLNGSGSGNALSYLWSPTAGLNNPTIAQPVTVPVSDITYTLTVRSAEGCTASDQVFVKVLKTPAVPNAFSPNGDGVHDKWIIEYLESYPGATVEVFNRYGQKVFESRGYPKPWDGTVNGKPLPIGTYYYLIDPKNGRKPLSGFVDIIR